MKILTPVKSWGRENTSSRTRRTQNCSTSSRSRNSRALLRRFATELLEFFGHPDAPYSMKRKPKDWAKVQAELEELKNTPPPVAQASACGFFARR